MTQEEILKADYINIIKDELLSSSSYYAQMALKAGDNKDLQDTNLKISQKYYDSLEWFNELTKNKQ
jgi:hypothetical protein